MRVNFKPTKSRAEKKKKRIQQVKALAEETREQLLKTEESMADSPGDVRQKMEDLGLTAVKRKQIIKKGKSKTVKALIADLKVQSKKLNKKNLVQKAEKKKISKQIKMLKAKVRKSGEEVSSSGESD